MFLGSLPGKTTPVFGMFGKTDGIGKLGVGFCGVYGSEGICDTTPHSRRAVEKKRDPQWLGRDDTIVELQSGFSADGTICV